MKQRPSDKRIVITGMGVVAPNAHGLQAFEGALREGRSGIRRMEGLREKGFRCQVGGIPQGVDELKARYFEPHLLMSMRAAAISYGSIAAIDAWKDAGLEVPPATSGEVRWDTGAVLGTGAAGGDLLGDIHRNLEAGTVRRLKSTYVEQMMMSGFAARVSGLLALGGPVICNSSACATGTEAVALGGQAIRDGKAERMVVGGAEAGGAEVWAPFDAMRVLVADHNHEPERASRPMSATASGFVPGSGAGVLVLESLESARKRGARIHAEVLGWASNCGGQRGGGSMTAPSPEGFRRCVLGAMEDAGVHPEEIDLINGHLTGTMADPLEIRNWRKTLGLEIGKFPLIQSTKSMIGHCIAAAGAIESIASVLQLSHGFVHGSLNCEDLHPEIEELASRIPRATIQADPRVVLRAGFGFGDVNTCAVYRRWEEK